MKVTVLQRSVIFRYAGEYPSLTVFLLSPTPALADTEENSLAGEGELSIEGAALRLTYREAESGVSCALLYGGDTLCLTRAGAELSFARGKRTAFTYRTAYGALPTEAYTERIELAQKGSAYLLTVVYTAVFSGIAQKNELRFKIKMK